MSDKRSKLEEMKDEIVNIVDDEGEVLQSKLKGKQGMKDWYKPSTINGMISHAVQQLVDEDRVDIERDVPNDGGGRNTNLLKTKSGSDE